MAKSNPVTAATLPVICNNSARCSESSATAANAPEPICICCKLKGTLAANLAISSNAFEPSSADPNKLFKRICRFSTSEPTPIIFFTATPAKAVPIAAPTFNALLDVSDNFLLILSKPLETFFDVLSDTFLILSISAFRDFISAFI